MRGITGVNDKEGSINPIVFHVLMILTLFLVFEILIVFSVYEILTVFLPFAILTLHLLLMARVFYSFRACPFYAAGSGIPFRIL